MLTCDELEVQTALRTARVAAEAASGATLPLPLLESLQVRLGRSGAGSGPGAGTGDTGDSKAAERAERAEYFGEPALEVRASGASSLSGDARGRLDFPCAYAPLRSAASVSMSDRDGGKAAKGTGKRGRDDKKPGPDNKKTGNKLPGACPLSRWSGEARSARCSGEDCACAWLPCESVLTLIVPAATAGAALTGVRVRRPRAEAAAPALHVNGTREFVLDPPDARQQQRQLHQQLSQRQQQQRQQQQLRARVRAPRPPVECFPGSIALPGVGAAPLNGAVVWLSLPLAAGTWESALAKPFLFAAVHEQSEVAIAFARSIDAAGALAAPAMPPRYAALTGARPTVNAFWSRAQHADSGAAGGAGSAAATAAAVPPSPVISVDEDNWARGGAAAALSGGPTNSSSNSSSASNAQCGCASARCSWNPFTLPAAAAATTKATTTSQRRASSSAAGICAPLALPPQAVCPPPLPWAPIEGVVIRTYDATATGTVKIDVKVTAPHAYLRALCRAASAPEGRPAPGLLVAGRTAAPPPLPQLPPLPSAMQARVDVRSAALLAGGRALFDGDDDGVRARASAARPPCAAHCGHCAHLETIWTAALGTSMAAPLRPGDAVARSGLSAAAPASLPWRLGAGLTLEFGASLDVSRRIRRAIRVLAPRGGLERRLGLPGAGDSSDSDDDGEGDDAREEDHSEGRTQSPLDVALTASSLSVGAPVRRGDPTPFSAFIKHHRNGSSNGGDRGRVRNFGRGLEASSAQTAAVAALAGFTPAVGAGNALSGGDSVTEVVELLQQPWLCMWPAARRAAFALIVEPALRRVLPWLLRAVATRLQRLQRTSGPLSFPRGVSVAVGEAAGAAVLQAVAAAVRRCVHGTNVKTVVVTVPLSFSDGNAAAIAADDAPLLRFSFTLSGLAGMGRAATKLCQPNSTDLEADDMAVLLALLRLLCPPLMQLTPDGVATAWPAVYTQLHSFDGFCPGAQQPLSAMALHLRQTTVDMLREISLSVPPPPALAPPAAPPRGVPATPAAAPATEQMWYPFFAALDLNASQRTAVSNVLFEPRESSAALAAAVNGAASEAAALLSAPSLNVIQGPPGTGKTQTISAAVWLWVRGALLRAPAGPEANVAPTRVLLSAYSNAALDLLTDRVRVLAAQADAAVVRSLTAADAAAAAAANIAATAVTRRAAVEAEARHTRGAGTVLSLVYPTTALELAPLRVVRIGKNVMCATAAYPRPFWLAETAALPGAGALYGGVPGVNSPGLVPWGFLGEIAQTYLLPGAVAPKRTRGRHVLWESGDRASSSLCPASTSYLDTALEHFCPRGVSGDVSAPRPEEVCFEPARVEAHLRESAKRAKATGLLPGLQANSLELQVLNSFDVGAPLRAALLVLHCARDAAERALAAAVANEESFATPDVQDAVEQLRFEKGSKALLVRLQLHGYASGFIAKRDKKVAARPKAAKKQGDKQDGKQDDKKDDEQHQILIPAQPAKS